MEREAEPDVLFRLAAAGEIDAVELRRALRAADRPPDAADWSRFVLWLSGGFGTASLVAGVVYLVAWNWDALGRLTKLGLAEGALLAAAIVAVTVGPERLGGRLAGAAAGCLTGPVLVLYTQLYQVGIDPWVLFAAFATALLPFAWATRLPALWALSGVSAQLAAGLAFAQLSPQRDPPWELFALGWTLVHLPLLGALRRLHRASGSTFVQRVLAVGALGLPAAVASVLLVDADPSPRLLAALLAAGLGVLGAHALHARRHGDLFVVVAALGAAITVVSTGLGRVLLEGLDELGFLPLSLAIALQGGLAALWVRHLGRRTR